MVVPAMTGSATATSDEVVLFEHAPTSSMSAAGIAIILELSRIR